MKIAVAQIASIKGDVDANITHHLQAMCTASEREVQYLVFPELSLTGYEPELAADLAFTSDDDRLQPLVEAAKTLNISIGVGAPFKSDGLPQIGMFIIKNSGIIEQYAKMNLHPGEEVYFSKGDSHHFVSLGKQKIANAICADTNSPQHALACRRAGCDIYMAGVLISESGYAADAAVLAKTAKDTSMLVAVANHNHPTGGWSAAGKSSIWSQEGLLASTNETRNALVIAQYELCHWKGEVVVL